MSDFIDRTKPWCGKTSLILIPFIVTQRGEVGQNVDFWVTQFINIPLRVFFDIIDALEHKNYKIQENVKLTPGLLIQHYF